VNSSQAIAANMLSPTTTKLSIGLAAVVCVVTIVLLIYSTVFNIPAPFSITYDHHLPLIATKIEDLGFVTDPVLNDGGIYHDGGGGATQNGYHVQIFADSATNSSGFNFVHNAVAYFGYVSLQ
jgi:hypothetical protein